jgi:hypothetical protein
VLEEILGEADELIRRRLCQRALGAQHVAMALTPDGQVVLRSNVSANILRSLGEDLKGMADKLTTPSKPSDATH